MSEGIRARPSSDGTAAKARDQVAQVFPPPGLASGQGEADAGRLRQRGRQGRGVDVAAGALDQGLDEVIPPGDEGPEGPEGLAQGTHQDRDLVRRQPGQFQTAAPPLADHPEPVGVVHQEPGPGLSAPTAASACKGARSPSMLKTPSVAIRVEVAPAWGAIRRARAAASPWA